MGTSKKNLSKIIFKACTSAISCLKTVNFLSKPPEFGGPEGGIINYLHDISLEENACYNHVSNLKIYPLSVFLISKSKFIFLYFYFISDQMLYQSQTEL